jgi:co-chaperonin GroES (HSP10)
MILNPLHDKVFFEFAENMSSNNFMPVSSGGIIMTDNYDFSQVREPKWGKVVRCGNEVSDDIKNSKFILIEPGKWTTQIRYSDEEKIWMTEEQFIMATSDDESATFRY